MLGAGALGVASFFSAAGAGSDFGLVDSAAAGALVLALLEELLDELPPLAPYPSEYHPLPLSAKDERETRRSRASAPQAGQIRCGGSLIRWEISISLPQDVQR